MFTGIVEEVGRAMHIQVAAEGAVLQIGASKVLEGTGRGDSIAVNGVCLTVTGLLRDGFSIDLSAETLRRTSLGELRSSQPLNLERSLSFGGKIGGHFVQGHVDGTGTVVRVMAEGEGRMIRFHAPAEVMRYIVPKGYVAVDGMSLTVVDPDAQDFTVAFIPHTLAHTIAQYYRPGTKVNLEADVLGKYVEKFMTGREERSAGVTLSLLKERGFTA